MSGFQTHKTFFGIGEQGASAYEVWLSLGNTGSEADFLQTLQAPPGSVPVSTDSGNRIEQRPDGLFVDPVSEGDFADMTLIFENALL